MFNLRLKQAQCALSDGQLDEAFRLLDDEGIRRHRAGQKLTAALSRAFVGRGRLHLQSERVQQAVEDCTKAEQLGGNRDEVAALKADICKAQGQRMEENARRNRCLEEARRRMDDGWLSAGADILGDVEHADADMLRQDAGVKRRLAEDVAQKAAGALQRGDIEAAIDLVRRAGTGLDGCPVIDAEVAAVRTAAAKRINDFLNAGRIDLGAAMLNRAMAIDGDTVQLRQLHDVLALCRRASAAVSTGQAREALTLLNRLSIMLPQAGWVEAARDCARRCAESFESLAAGPLGFVEGGVCTGAPHVNDDLPSRPAVLPQHDLPSGADETAAGDTAVGSRFVLQIDGVGAYLVLRESRVTVGPVSSSRRPTVGLIAGAGLPTAGIERQDEHYVISSDEQIMVGDVLTRKKLLETGDKIALSPRCRMRFEMPNAASNTAVLALSSAKLSRPDINHVILMDRDILIGSGTKHHVCTRDGIESVALFIQEGRLYARTRGDIAVDGRRRDSRKPLPVGVPIRIGPLNIVITGAADGLGEQEH